MNKEEKIKEVKLLLEEYEKLCVEAIQAGKDQGLSSFELILGAAQTGLTAAVLTQKGYSPKEVQDLLLKLSKELEKGIDQSLLEAPREEPDDFDLEANHEEKKKTLH